MRNSLNDYSNWLDRKPTHPNLGAGTWVKLLPEQLGGGSIVGRINWEDGTSTSYAVYVPYGEDGALIYVHKADVEPTDPPEKFKHLGPPRP